MTRTKGGEAREIERKWLVDGWPQGLAPCAEYEMQQGYLAVRPTVRIRREAQLGGETQHILCFKGAGSLSRKEIETEISPALFAELEVLIEKPLIPKLRRDYALPGGLVLEVNLVDEGSPTAFFYAEVEFGAEQEALSWQPPKALQGYLGREVTREPGQSMGAYWLATRGTP